MITFLGWIGALVALATALAMLKDTYLTVSDRAEFRGILCRAWYAWRIGGWPSVDRAELSVAVRLLLRMSVLVVVVGSSGVCVIMPDTGGLYGALLRCALAVFMAMQAPCPWVHWILVGDRRHAQRQIHCGGDRRVH